MSTLTEYFHSARGIVLPFHKIKQHREALIQAIVLATLLLIVSVATIMLTTLADKKNEPIRPFASFQPNMIDWPLQEDAWVKK